MLQHWVLHFPFSIHSSFLSRDDYLEGKVLQGNFSTHHPHSILSLNYILFKISDILFRLCKLVTGVIQNTFSKVNSIYRINTDRGVQCHEGHTNTFDSHNAKILIVGSPLSVFNTRIICLYVLLDVLFSDSLRRIFQKL